MVLLTTPPARPASPKSVNVRKPTNSRWVYHWVNYDPETVLDLYEHLECNYHVVSKSGDDVLGLIIFPSTKTEVAVQKLLRHAVWAPVVGPSIQRIKQVKLYGENVEKCSMPRLSKMLG